MIQIKSHKAILVRFDYYLKALSDYKEKKKDKFYLSALHELRALEERVFTEEKEKEEDDDHNTESTSDKITCNKIITFDAYHDMCNATHLNKNNFNNPVITINNNFSIHELLLFGSHFCRICLEQVGAKHPGKSIRKLLEKHGFKPKKYGKKKRL